MPEKARVLDVSDGWLRVEHELGGGAPWSKKETAVRLIDIDIIDSVLAWPNEMIVRMRQRARRRSRDGAFAGYRHRAARLRFEQAAQEKRFLERERIRSLRARAEGERRVRRSQLRKLHGCACAFTLWAPGRIFADESPSTQGRGIILDSDDEWVLIECPAPFGAKGATQRLFRIADIKSVAEIVG